MARERVSTTVDGELLALARGLRGWANDAALLDAALRTLVADHRSNPSAAKSVGVNHPKDA
jgi:hypothetical protein